MPSVTSGQIEAMRRAMVALECATSLLPPKTPPQRWKAVASRILSICWDDTAGFTQSQAQELISPHMQCIARNCPLCVFWEPIARSIRLFFGGKE